MASGRAWTPYFWGVKPAYITDEFLTRFIDAALREDVGDGDHSSLASIPAKSTNTAALLVKDEGILAGVELAEKIFQHGDPEPE
jgi:nicotinate-nucleotide pyrophosphorylase (carboxylating)